MSATARPGVFPLWSDGRYTVMTWDDLDAVHTLLADIAPGWSAELNRASLNESTIVVMPDSANDLVGPSFILYWADGRVRLDQFRWDEYRKLGSFATRDDALAAMTARLVPLVSPRPFSPETPFI